MISFACSHCGMKLKVKPEFAGRTSRCPTCKKPLVVPAVDKTLANLPSGEIDGMPSSIVQAGVDGGVTLQQPASTPRPGQKSIQELLNRQTKNRQRYMVEGEIARGGMGAVLRAVDHDIRREVAVKYLLDQADPNKKLRFIEEAQITGQLEHPNIPPVHELGIDAQKRLFFSMKMVKGRSLAQVLDDLRTNPKAAEMDWSPGRLLNIFVNVCNGLAYAHSRGVVHRDLKPANIMVGDYGEVYVMDWGLAKVLTGDGPAVDRSGSITGVAIPASGNSSAPLAVPASSGQSIAAPPSSKVVTSREPEADLTQEGAVLGTPVYMPPEQAAGKVDAIDHRSDIYSLGAILYEMLTLQPPIDKEGGYLAILMRVMQGEIVPPEQRNPQRARAGKIPRDLSAVALKAMATNPQDRYPNVEALRRDIERFQEGRSVSAKQDTFQEMAWKLVKRNQVASAFTTVLAVVLIWSSVVNFLARRDAEQANARTKETTEKAVPALVEAARLGVERRNYPNALKQVDLALAYRPDDGDALLLRGQLLIVQHDYSRARAELEKYLEQRPKDVQAKRLVELCQQSHPDDEATSLGFANVFNQQETYGLIDGVLAPYGKTSVEARNVLLQKYHKQIEAAWPAMRGRLQINTDGLRLNLQDFTELRDLTPLKGIPLTALDLSNCGQVSDLTPLKGMPLTGLTLVSCNQVRDLTPLKSLPLTDLNLSMNGQVSDLTPLKDMPLTSLNLYYCLQVRDLTPLKGLPLTTLDLGNCDQLHDLTPLAGLQLTDVRLLPKNITKGMDVLRQMKSLKTIRAGTTVFSPSEFWKKYDAGDFKQ